MKTTLSILLCAFVIHSGFAKESPAELNIATAQKLVSERPGDAGVYPPLALALAARARETADVEFYAKAMAAVQKSLALEPDNFAARKAEAWILLGQHEFQKALEITRALNKRSGDDPMVYALRTDAAIETGNYDEAETAAQWALDMDQGAVPGLTRAAYLRELFGDLDGAIELMKLAFNRIRSTDSENQAWLLTHLGHLFLLKNETEKAEQAQLSALEAFPGYHYALANLAHVRTAQGDYKAALELHRQHYAAAAHPENLYELAVAMRRAGENEEADKAFAEFEEAALSESQNVDNANRELVSYYVDEAKDPVEALRVAEVEMGHRQDYRTRQAYAWALHAGGQKEKAYDEIKTALAIGVKYPVMQYQAGIIARDAGDKESAKKLLQASIYQAPQSSEAKLAKIALESL
jgi:tetratricopeptide (TPR) repeat protein